MRRKIQFGNDNELIDVSTKDKKSLFDRWRKTRKEKEVNFFDFRNLRIDKNASAGVINYKYEDEMQLANNDVKKEWTQHKSKEKQRSLVDTSTLENGVPYSRSLPVVEEESAANDSIATIAVYDDELVYPSIDNRIAKQSEHLNIPEKHVQNHENTAHTAENMPGYSWADGRLYNAAEHVPRYDSAAHVAENIPSYSWAGRRHHNAAEHVPNHDSAAHIAENIPSYIWAGRRLHNAEDTAEHVPRYDRELRTVENNEFIVKDMPGSNKAHGRSYYRDKSVQYMPSCDHNTQEQLGIRNSERSTVTFAMHGSHTAAVDTTNTAATGWPNTAATRGPNNADREVSYSRSKRNPPIDPSIIVITNNEGSQVDHSEFENDFQSSRKEKVYKIQERERPVEKPAIITGDLPITDIDMHQESYADAYSKQATGGMVFTGGMNFTAGTTDKEVTEFNDQVFDGGERNAMFMPAAKKRRGGENEVVGNTRAARSDDIVEIESREFEKSRKRISKNGLKRNNSVDAGRKRRISDDRGAEQRNFDDTRREIGNTNKQTAERSTESSFISTDNDEVSSNNSGVSSELRGVFRHLNKQHRIIEKRSDQLISFKPHNRCDTSMTRTAYDLASAVEKPRDMPVFYKKNKPTSKAVNHLSISTNPMHISKPCDTSLTRTAYDLASAVDRTRDRHTRGNHLPIAADAINSSKPSTNTSYFNADGSSLLSERARSVGDNWPATWLYTVFVLILWTSIVAFINGTEGQDTHSCTASVKARLWSCLGGLTLLYFVLEVYRGKRGLLKATIFSHFVFLSLLISNKEPLSCYMAQNEQHMLRYVEAGLNLFLACCLFVYWTKNANIVKKRQETRIQVSRSVTPMTLNRPQTRSQNGVL